MVSSIPNVAVIAFEAVALQEGTKLILKRMLCVVGFLCVDVSEQSTQVFGSEREDAVASLPCEVRQGRRLRLDPFGRRGLYFRNQRCYGDRTRQADRKMHVVSDAAGAVTFASSVARDSCKVRIERGANVVGEAWSSILGAEDHVDEDEAQRLCHRGDYRSGFQPSEVLDTVPGATPQAGMGRAFSARIHGYDTLAFHPTLVWLRLQPSEFTDMIPGVSPQAGIGRAFSASRTLST